MKLLLGLTLFLFFFIGLSNNSILHPKNKKNKNQQQRQTNKKEGSGPECQVFCIKFCGTPGTNSMNIVDSSHKIKKTKNKCLINSSSDISPFFII